MLYKGLLYNIVHLYNRTHEALKTDLMFKFVELPLNVM